MYMINSTDFRDGFKAGVKGRLKANGWYTSPSVTFVQEVKNTNTTLFKDCAWQAYVDASRKFSKINSIGNKKTNIIEVWLGSELHCYFKSQPKTQAQFDKWHQNLCNSFIAEFNNAGYQSVTIGMAQKVINLAFKYLYCIDGANQYKNYFSYCHMALDDYVLNWYSREVNPKNKIKEWSTMTSYGDYIDIQKKIGSHLNQSVTLLEKEFYVFADEFVVEALEQLRSAIDGYNFVKHPNQVMVDLFNKPFDPSNPNTKVIDFISNF